MTPQELIELIEGLIVKIEAFLRKQYLAPPAAIRDLTVAVNRSTTMTTATLNWTLPTTRVPVPPATVGAPLAPSDIGGLNIFDSAASDPTVPIASITSATTFTTDALTPGTHTFTVVVTDTAGHESAPSNAASGDVGESTVGAPSAITDLTVTINP